MQSSSLSSPLACPARVRTGRGAFLAAAALFCCASSAWAVNFGGNGNTGFGGAIGNGVLSLTDDGTNIHGTLTVGGSMNDVLVIYVQTGAGSSFADTSTFNDQADGLRKAISGAQGSDRSLMSFTNGFRPNFAIALGPSADNFGGIWQLASGNNNSLIYTNSANLSPTGTGTGPFTFSVNCADIGLATNVQATIKIFGTYIANSAYRSTEAIAGNATGTQGYFPFTQTAFTTYTFNAGATPTYQVNFSVDMSVAVANASFNPANGDTVYAAGSFETTPWSGLALTNDAAGANVNLYSGSSQDANPLGTAEQFKFKFHSVSGNNDVWENSDNRPFTLQSGGQTLPTVYFDDLAPAPGTNYLTFRIDMTPQYQLGHFDTNTEGVEVRGTFQTPTQWSGGFALTNDPNGANPLLFSGTYPDGNYPGSWEQYKFVKTGATTTYESIANRTFVTPAGAYTFPVVYWENVSSAYAVPVTFQVDMSAQVYAGNLNPSAGHTVGVAGSFQTNQWTTTPPDVCILTNNPAGPNTNLYSGTYVVPYPPATGEQYKFFMNTNTGILYESRPNRSFVLGSSAQTLPPVYWNDLDAHDVTPVDTYVTFHVDMRGAVDRYGNPFDPANDALFVNGDFIPWWDWTDPLLGASGHADQYQMREDLPLGSGFYHSDPVRIPAGNSLELVYKYAIYHDTANANTNADNEAGFSLNHTRYIRALGTYSLPMDIFGQQRTNLAAATEISFGNLAAGAPVAGNIPVTWLGRPGVHLQSSAAVTGGWVDHLNTDGLSATNWPVLGTARFFRLIKP